MVTSCRSKICERDRNDGYNNTHGKNAENGCSTREYVNRSWNPSVSMQTLPALLRFVPNSNCATKRTTTPRLYKLQNQVMTQC